jgi:hypothetical protein
MPNLRLIMKFSDQRLAWSERHWWYQGPASGTPVLVSPPANLNQAYTAAIPLIAARVAMLSPQSQFIGAVLSFDDNARDGYPFATGVGPGTFPGVTPGPILDPELSVMIQATANNPAGGSLSSRFYVSPTYASNVNDQVYNPAGNPAWDLALQNYLTILNTNTTGSGWGWKGVLTSPGVTQLLAGGPPIITVVNGQVQFQFAMQGALPGVGVGQIVKMSQIVQGKGASPRLNGRWIVVENVGTALTLGRKYFPPYTSLPSVNYQAGGLITPAFYIIYNYATVRTGRLVKRDRGGSLGLPRGRARTRTSNV